MIFNLENINKNRKAIITPHDSYSYAELTNEVFNLSEKIVSHQLLFLLCKNNIESIIGYLSSLNRNTVVLPVNSDIDQQTLLNLIEIYQPRYIFKSKDRIIEGTAELTNLRSYNLIETVFKNSPSLPAELALLLSTSGSTGSPKLVRLSLNNILSNATSIAQYLKIDENERPITSLPMYYSFGLSVINSHLIKGATILLNDYSYVQREFWQFANHNNFTSFSGVPYTFEILKKINFWTLPTPSLKTITQAGGKLSNDLLKYFIENSEERGIKFITMYGQTEATARMSFLPQEYGLSKLGSIGIAIPGGAFEIAGDNGEILKDNEIGELIYHGSNVSLGYAEKHSDLYEKDNNNGTLYTGDMGYRDKDGFFFITGRKKRFLKLAGNRISLDYVEQLLLPYLKENVCVGNDSKLYIFTTDQDFNSDEIINFLSSKLKIIKPFFEIRRIEKIPRSETGKIQYSKLEF